MMHRRSGNEVELEEDEFEFLLPAVLAPAAYEFGSNLLSSLATKLGFGAAEPAGSEEEEEEESSEFEDRHDVDSYTCRDQRSMAADETIAAIRDGDVDVTFDGTNVLHYHIPGLNQVTDETAEELIADAKGALLGLLGKALPAIGSKVAEFFSGGGEEESEFGEEGEEGEEVDFDVDEGEEGEGDFVDFDAVVEDEEKGWLTSLASGLGTAIKWTTPVGLGYQAAKYLTGKAAESNIPGVKQYGQVWQSAGEIAAEAARQTAASYGANAAAALAASMGEAPSQIAAAEEAESEESEEEEETESDSVLETVDYDEDLRIVEVLADGTAWIEDNGKKKKKKKKGFLSKLTKIAPILSILPGGSLIEKGLQIGAAVEKKKKKKSSFEEEQTPMSGAQGSSAPAAFESPSQGGYGSVRPLSAIEAQNIQNMATREAYSTSRQIEAQQVAEVEAESEEEEEESEFEEGDDE